MTAHRPKRPARRLRPRRALEVVFPAVMALIVCFVFTDILFAGGRRESLAAKVEKRLLEMSLRLGAYDAVSPGAVVTVSLGDAEQRRLAAAPPSLLRDAHLATYAEVLRRVAAARPRLVVVSWLPGAHPADPDYWQPLEAALRSAPEPWNVVIAYPISQVLDVPAAIRRDFQVLEAEDCIYEVNSYCSYNPSWTNWLIQSLANRLWQAPPAHHVSDNLPHVLPNFILNLPRRRSIPDVSFSAVLTGAVPAEVLHDRLVFIGNNTGQEPLLRNNKGLLRRTYTAESDAGAGSLLAHGTPLHAFWAQVAQMFIDRTTVAVQPRGVCLAALAAVSLVILVVMARYGQAASVALLLGAVVAAPSLNALALRYAHAYLPLFPVGYGGLLVYVFSAFGLMSFHNFKRAKLEAEQRSYALTADLKSNFISLISHNLNTPIAKLLGLVDVLTVARRLPGGGAALDECRRLVTQMQFYARSALLSTTLEQRGGPPVQGNAKALLREFDQGARPLLRRLGIELAVSPSPEATLFAATALDPRLGAHALAALALLAADGRALPLRCEVHGPTPLPTGAPGLALAVVLPAGAAPPAGLRALLAGPADADDDDPGNADDAASGILAQYARAVAAAHGGALTVEDAGERPACVILTVPLVGPLVG